MTKNKTQETESPVIDFINSIENEQKRKDSFELIRIFQEVSGFEPKMWGTSIIGFGNYHYKYESGHEGDAPLTGFSPRKAAISLYFSCDIEDQHGSLLAQLGKFKNGKSCVYINKLSDVKEEIIKALAKESIHFIQEKYPIK
ncbi:DUF1801 domain-containing protein [Aquiflexum gelatinilyticum]|uniref:DUF1801 domain-containing protein n=1 Tax=Aquiflexum gelatinilyticum TaxID=2961943 RepID=UPI0021676268|nr:DUF1801 domain-containing protein [Aquiflexum gelatinilyticum]MCS4435372.1 DUF1801 domain-containing protein [Aquiflexum gelatinilyticum]